MTTTAVAKRTVEVLIPDAKDKVIASLDSPTLLKLAEAGGMAREELNRRVVAWVKDGWTQRKMAAELGCSHVAVGKRLAKLGVKSSSSRGGDRIGNPVTKAIEAKAIDITDEPEGAAPTTKVTTKPIVPTPSSGQDKPHFGDLLQALDKFIEVEKDREHRRAWATRLRERADELDPPPVTDAVEVKASVSRAKAATKAVSDPAPRSDSKATV